MGSQTSTFLTSTTPAQVSVSLPANTASPGKTGFSFTTTQTYTVPSTSTTPSGIRLTTLTISGARLTLAAVKQVTEDFSLPAYTNSQSGTPSVKPTAEGSLPLIRAQITTTLLVTQSKSGVAVKTHTIPMPFLNNPPWFTNSDLIVPPQPTGAGDYTAPEGYTISSHLYPVTQEDGVMTHTTITFIVEQTATPTSAQVSADEEKPGTEGVTVDTTAAASTRTVTATVTDTAVVAASSTPQAPSSLSRATTTRSPQPSKLITTIHKPSETETAADFDATPELSTLTSTSGRHPTSTRTVQVQASAELNNANGEGLQSLEPRQVEWNYRTRTSIIRQTTTISQPNPLVIMTPAPIRPRQHVSGYNPQVAVAVQQPRPNRAKGPKVVIEGDEVVVYTTWTATVWKGPGITFQQPHLTTAVETQVAVEAAKPTYPILGDPEESLPDDGEMLVQSDCQPVSLMTCTISATFSTEE